MSHPEKRSPSPEVEESFKKREFLNTLAAENDGKTIALLETRLKKINTWIQDIRPDFTKYKEAESNFKKWEAVENRLPKPEELTTLSLDIRPEIGQDRDTLATAKRQFYEAIRSGDAHTHQHSENRLHLTIDERKKVLTQLNTICDALKIDRPDFERLLFPDESFSVPEKDFTDAHKQIDYPFMRYYLAINEIISVIANAQRERKYLISKAKSQPS